MISTRYAANLPDIVKELRTHSIYIYANNLCGWAMSQYLHTHGFKFLTDEEVRSRFPACDINTHLASISDTADTGYILKVDLEYASTLKKVERCRRISNAKLLKKRGCKTSI